MGANLIEHLQQVKDFRTTDGRRHPLWLVLLLVIMGTLSGYVGYRAWGDFAKRHRRALIEVFGSYRHGVPSYSTIRRVLMGIVTVQNLIATLDIQGFVFSLDALHCQKKLAS